VQEQFARRFWVDGFGWLRANMRDVGVVEPDLVVFHAGEGVADLSLAARTTDLRAVQSDIRPRKFRDVIIPARFGMVNMFQPSTKAAKRVCLRAGRKL